MKLKLVSTLILLTFFAVGCGSFKAKRVDSQEADEKALEITDAWMVKDTEIAIGDILTQMKAHRGFRDYLTKLGRAPKVFIAEVQNETAEAYFPIDDLNDELLQQFSNSGEFILVDAKARDIILKEIKYQNDGMVDPQEMKKIGKQAGADLLIFGTARMKPESRDGKTIKEYTINMRMTDIERGVEVLRTRSKVNKFSKKGGVGW